jgi:hypothetical protein
MARSGPSTSVFLKPEGPPLQYLQLSLALSSAAKAYRLAYSALSGLFYSPLGLHRAAHGALWSNPFTSEQRWGSQFDAKPNPRFRASGHATGSARWGRGPGPDGVSTAEKHRDVGAARTGSNPARRNGRSGCRGFDSRCQEGGWCLGVGERASLSSDEKKGPKCQRMHEGEWAKTSCLSKSREMGGKGGLVGFATLEMPGFGNPMPIDR